MYEIEEKKGNVIFRKKTFSDIFVLCWDSIQCPRSPSILIEPPYRSFPKMCMKFSPLRLWKVPTESSISSLRSHLLFLSFPFQVLTILLIKVANKKRFERKVRQRSINVRFANTRKFPLGIVHKWRHGRKGVMHFLTAVLRP